jgi:hypothetical protein
MRQPLASATRWPRPVTLQLPLATQHTGDPLLFGRSIVQRILSIRIVRLGRLLRQIVEETIVWRLRLRGRHPQNSSGESRGKRMVASLCEGSRRPASAVLRSENSNTSREGSGLMLDTGRWLRVQYLSAHGLNTGV